MVVLTLGTSTCVCVNAFLTPPNPNPTASLHHSFSPQYTHTRSGHASPHIPSLWPLLVREQQVGANSAGPFFLALCLADLPRLLIIACSCIPPFFLAGLHTIPKAATFFGQFFLLHFLTVSCDWACPGYLFIFFIFILSKRLSRYLTCLCDLHPYYPNNRSLARALLPTLAHHAQACPLWAS